MSTAILLHWLIGFPLALVVANFSEWVIHKRVLHGRGRKKGNFWNFHWYEHHAAARKSNMLDPAYDSGSLLHWNPRTKELAALASGLPVYLALMVSGVAPGVGAGFIYATVNYYWAHRRAHRDPEWARRKLPWHVDHHMGPNQDANWCVTRPWADWVLGTREKYVGTEKERADAARRTEREARRQTA